MGLGIFSCGVSCVVSCGTYFLFVFESQQVSLKEKSGPEVELLPVLNGGNV